NEPLSLLRQTLIGCLAQEYPRDRFKVYVLDDGRRDDVRELASLLGCGYLCRPDSPRHAKAGNLNNALGQTNGELVAVFDVDHVPTRIFLKETVGFFEDPAVAFVQTPHHFYNPDIFQRNLRLDDRLKNEQALFFRSLQAGRDSHNSAFFAGSGGLFRRKPLEEIGGFRTDTITEDIHTSMSLHAKGYRSCYLNRVLSAGLMPETFEGFLKQRKRWAIGCIQVLLRDNPLFKGGLSLAQRIDYFGSIFYFLFGVPRVISLVAPLSSLLFSIPPIKADPIQLAVFFLSFYMASALAMRPISGGSRNPFWSDIYETAMCFSLSWAAVKTFATPRRERRFEVTPKGERVMKSAPQSLRLVWPHLAVFGLLAVGLTLGFQRLAQGAGEPGLPVSLLWGSINLLFVTIAMFVANEQPQARRGYRLKRDFASELAVDGRTVPARIRDITEYGASVVLERPIFTAQETVTLLLTSPQGTIVRVTGRIVRQEPSSSGNVVLGLLFIDIDDETVRKLVEKNFGEASPWEDGYQFKPGVVNSARFLLLALGAPWKSFSGKRRRMPRISLGIPCQLHTSSHRLTGRLKDISFTGVSALFPSIPPGSTSAGRLELSNITLKLSPVSIHRGFRNTCVRFKVESIEHGKERWRELHEQRWRPS
ncbi:MAG: glycosyltransferase, partial [Nitrospira sp.]|nr:glycosyltransferase [Nitrospira sp.]